MWDLAQTIERVGAKIPGALAPPGALARAQAVARRLPADLTGCFYFERRLRDDTPRVDFIFRVDAAARSRLEDLPSRFEDDGPSHSSWARIASFARAWRETGTRMEQEVEAIWVELDLPVGGPPPVPRVFVDFTPLSPPASAEARGPLALEVLRVLMGGELDLALEENVRACFERLPSAAYVPYVGLTPGVATAPVRLCAQSLGAHTVSYLEEVGWPGRGAHLRGVLDALSAAKADGSSAASVVHVDLQPRVAPRIGLECPFARDVQWEGRLRETGLLDHVVARGWCAPEARDALLQWPGREVELLPHDIWPTRVGRRVAHLKLTLAPDEETILKAYLCVRLDPARGATLLGARPFVPASSAPAPRQPRAIE